MDYIHLDKADTREPGLIGKYRTKAVVINLKPEDGFRTIPVVQSACLYGSNRHIAVIASAAKQSLNIAPLPGDCFVATLLAMTEKGTTRPLSINS